MEVTDEQFFKKLPQNPNPNAMAGFIIFFPFQYFVFKNIYRHLEKEGEFIVDAGIVSKFTPVALETINKTIDLLKKENVYFRVFDYGSLNKQDYAPKFFKDYRVLINLWWLGCLQFPCVKKIRKV